MVIFNVLAILAILFELQYLTAGVKTIIQKPPGMFTEMHSIKVRQQLFKLLKLNARIGHFNCI